MASRIRTIDFLPEIFRTETNKQFLSSTLDQLVQEPKLKPTQGYIGRRVGPGVNPNDQYIIEPTVERANYQLEPSLTFLESDKNTVTDVLTYPGYIDRLRLKGANVNRHDRLFNSEYYSWDPFVDFDKFVNFGQYYWLPAGPDSVDVSATDIPTTDDFTVTRTTSGYTFSDVVGTLPTITLARQGSYTFDVNQTGNPFWIQTTPGADGTLSFNTQSSREVLGVVNNGEDLGTVTFNVPGKSDQQFYLELSSSGTVDLVTDLKFNQINNILLSEFINEHGSIDGITDLDSRTIIFSTTISGEDGGWVETTQFDNVQGYDGEVFDKSSIIEARKYSVWQITYVYDSNGENPIITLSESRTVEEQTTLTVNYGTLYANTKFWKTAEGYYEKVPLLTANLDILYYQDGTQDNLFGVIKLVDQEDSDILDISDIIGLSSYTSPNGVTFTNGLKVQFEGRTFPTTYSGNEYYVEGVGTSIQLLPVTDFLTPEDFAESLTTPYDIVGYDIGGWDGSENAPINKDYMVINRASPDKNAWSRNNRWFHIDVITATANYNNVSPVVDNTARANRPIIEFRSGMRLFNSGTQAIDPVDLIDTRELDAFSNINGTTGYNFDGVDLVDGTRIIFAADTDPAVRNKIYEVSIVEFDDSSDPVISLQPANIDSTNIVVDNTVLIKSGVVNGGKSFYYNGSDWIEAQQKIAVNQAPLFDLFDNNGYSFGDTTVYLSSTFTGSKLFGYAVGTGVDDAVIGQPLKYLNINNVGDIVFENYINTDTFTYVSGNTSFNQNVSIGYAREYSDRTTYTSLLGWQTSSNEVVSIQSFNFEYEGIDLVLDVSVDDSNNVPVKVFVDGEFLLPTNYTYSTNSSGVTQITFINEPTIGSLIEVTVSSTTASQVANYTIPSNLENNSINTNETELTLGTVRNHYNTICQNIDNFVGTINGANNLRDLGNTVPYGRSILQQSSPLTLLGTFLNDSRFDFFKSAEFVSTEYEKFKNRLLDEAIKTDWQGYTTNEILDSVIETLNAGKNENSPFYWSDMIPSGKTYDETSYTVSNITTNIFDTLYSYDFSSANFSGILVYLNDVLLIANGNQYTVASDGPRIVINTDVVTLNNGDIVKIREYSATYGSYIPPTPTSLGLSPPWQPEIFADDTYVTTTNVIRGHDGSLTVAYNDFRDDLLLEFEKRVYNNLKIVDKYNPPLNIIDVIPGQARTTEYTLAEINEILSIDFLRWIGTTKLSYNEQTYDANNPFTWNYSRSANKLSGEPLQGNWRAIYQHLYDTDSPHTRPWEMLGLTEKPSWWDNRYGATPYTSGNLVLWEDLRDGYLADPDNPQTLNDYVRPNLLDIIPVDSEGNLLSPRDTIMGEYDSNNFRKSWTWGDGGPVETAWRRSSGYQFALQRLLALTKPAKYFSLFADRDSYKYNTSFGQFLVNNRGRIQPSNVSVYGNGISQNSYINWIIDYNRIVGLDSTSLLEERLNNIDIRLAYRMSGFSDKQYLKIFSEKSSPDSLNNSLLIPDESYQMMLYKNPAFDEVNYSSVIIQRTTDGYSIFGYSTLNPYFEILSSIPNGRYTSFNLGGNDYRIAKDFRNSVVRVPYGYTFTSKSSVVDFLVSYGQLLNERGMSFDNIENNIVVNWDQMAQEFVYWADANWTVGSLINLNPGADLIKITKENAVAENLISPGTDNIMLNQNKKAINSTDFVVERISNDLTLRALTNNNFNLLSVRFTAYEHIIVLDNTSIFNDLIYNPGTGARQGRLLVNGYKTFDWDGTLDAQGFILNQDNVQEWIANRAYSKGEIVLYKNSYWSAAEIIPPSETFDFSVWIKSDYDRIQKGLLPNIATKSNLIRNNYDTYSANLERDSDLLGFGLIGFRKRQYMQNLNLDDVSQVNLYKQFLGSKGTLKSAEIFSFANLNKEVAEYKITENWAIQRASYGATANRNFIELRLLEENLFANPSTVKVIESQETSSADQEVLVDDIWKESTKITSTNIFPTYTSGTPDRVLPDAGYINYDDVDIKVFDFNNLSAIVNNLDDIVAGSNIWVAKSNAYDWNVYRTNLIPASLVQVNDNLNNTCTFVFDAPHNLTVGDKIIVKYFNLNVDGAYEVASVTGAKTITVALSLPGDATSIADLGVCFVLLSVRVSQSSDINNLSIANRLVSGSKVWSDNDGTDRWVAYEKVDPYAFSKHLEPDVEEINMLYGTSVAIGIRGFGGLVGAPGYNSGLGGIYTYNRTGETGLVQTSILQTNTTGLLGFGTTISAGDSEYSVTGAPNSNSGQGYAYVVRRNPDNSDYFVTQCLVEENTSAGDNYGHSVVISGDERWMFVGAPGNDTVYAYNKVVTSIQDIEFIGDGSTNQFDISSAIVVDDDSTDKGIGKHQLSVFINNLPVTDNEWAYGDGLVTFATIPNQDDVIRVTRKQSITLEVTNLYEMQVNEVYSIDSAFNNNIYSFSVTLNNVLLRPFLDYTYDSSTKILTFNSGEYPTGVTGDLLITASTYWKLITSFNYFDITGESSDDNTGFGHSITSTTDGRQILVGAPYDTVNGINNAGSVIAIDRSVLKYQIESSDHDGEFTDFVSSDSSETVYGTPAVKLNGTFLVIDDGTNIDGQYTWDGSTVTISATLSAGDIVEIETNEFKMFQKITAQVPANTTNFGSVLEQCTTNCSTYIGNINDSTVAKQAGSVDRWANNARLFGTTTTTIANPSVTVGHSIRINNYEVVLTGTTVAETVDDINNADLPNIVASTSDGFLTITLTDVAAGDTFTKLQVMPGVGSAYTDLGIQVLDYAQTIRPPVSQEYSHFGSAVINDINNGVNTLIVGAPDGSAIAPTTFDSNTTAFDGSSTEVIDTLEQSGAVYTYNFLSSANTTASNPGSFVFGQEIYYSDINDLHYSSDRFGSAIAYYNGLLLIGTPQDDLGDSVGNFGQASLYYNSTRGSSWKALYQQQDIVDVQLLNSVFTYDRRDNQINRYLDYIDPIQGKILGSARQNIDYIIGIDPAQYNVGPTNNNGQFWAQNQVGEVWWNTSTVRFVDYHQDDVAYKARRWGQLFPGSTVDVYQWIESDVPPVEYDGEGTVFDVNSYTVGSSLDVNGLFTSKYYFWVKGINSVSTEKNKTLSVTAVAQYIENPRSSGIPYIAVIGPSEIALYNCRDGILANDTILHIEYDNTRNTDNVHVEYDLISDGIAESFLSDGLYRKMQDSFSGTDTLGNLVPDVNLSTANKYGIQYRPRQSMFQNRFLALENYLSRANSILALFPIAESRRFALLNSEEEMPNSVSGQWDKLLDTYAELTYQNLDLVSVGYKYLIAADETQNGLWTIYTVQSDRSLLLTKVQSYNTKNYWSYIDWVQPGYNIAIKPIAEVATKSELQTISNVNQGDSVKVTGNSYNKYEIYQYLSGEWVRVVAEDSTIAIDSVIWNLTEGRYGFGTEVFDSQRFDQNPSTETRQIIRALNEEIFTGDLLIYRNELLVLIFEYILTEQTAPEWLVKTSLVDVNHKIRDLKPFQIYRRDNQDFVQDYINEVKPYHVKIKEFNLRYEGLDTFQGTLADFDVPAYYDNTYGKFISPVIDDTVYDEVTPALESHLPSTDPIWQTLPWSQWYNNYKLSIGSVSVTDGGSGYTVPPEVIVIGTGTRAAELVARISTSGEVIAIDVIDSGDGYIVTPEITISGGNGTGAKAIPVTTQRLTRSFNTTLKFDRYEYTTSVVNWAPNTFYDSSDLVKYNNKVYTAVELEDSAEIITDTFDPSYFEEVDQSTLTGVDRIIGLYQPDVEDPGRELQQLIAGIDYPGVQVQGPDFDKDPGFDVGNFDIAPFGDPAPGDLPEGSSRISDTYLDTIYESSFTDSFLGTRTSGIIVDGGEFIDTYSSHAPEELVPGSTFDTLQLTVTTDTDDSTPVRFRIFQDMNKNQKIFRILEANTTTLSSDLESSEDTISVVDASSLPEPDLENGVFGVITINGERILYRTRNTTDNTLSGLRRGVAGTAASAHSSGDEVIGSAVTDQLPSEYQQITDSYSVLFTGDGSTDTFVATGVTIGTSLDSTEIERVVQVKVGGTLLSNSEYTVTQLDPQVEVVLETPIPENQTLLVEIFVIKANWMYEITSDGSTLSTLEYQPTDAGRFIRGEI